MLAVLFLAGGCAPARVVEDKGLAGTKTIGVVSAIGDTFRMSEIGAMVFMNRESDNPVEDWNVDGEATSIARRTLETAGAYKVVAVPTRRHAEIAQAHRANLARHIDLEAMREILRAAQPQPAVDAFLVLAKDRGREPCRPDTTVFVQGIGICAGPVMQMSPASPLEEVRDIVGPFGNRMVAPFASYRMAVYRASDFEVLASRSAAIHRSERSILGLPKTTSSVPYKQIHSAAYKESFDRFTPDERRAIRAVIIELLETSIPETLKTMGLISH
jgi:hypothetical protein